jgi:hypothetical protein
VNFVLRLPVDAVETIRLGQQVIDVRFPIVGT